MKRRALPGWMDGLLLSRRAMLRAPVHNIPFAMSIGRQKETRHTPVIR